MRDPQVTKVYKAEEALRSKCESVADAKAAEEWIHTIQQSRWYRRTWPSSVKVSVSSSFATGWAGYVIGQDRIVLTEKHERWAYNKLVLTHELSHHVSVDGHGPWFCGAHLWIVEHAIGKETALLLEESYKKHKVISVQHNYIEEE